MGAFDAGFPARAVANPVQYGAGIVTNPLHLPIAAAGSGSGNIMYKSASATVTYLNFSAPSGFTTAAITTTALTNVVNISGTGGIVSHIITPIGDAGNTCIPTVFIVVDGVTYTYTMNSAMSSTYRLVFGALVTGLGGASSIGSTVQQADLVGVGAYYDTGHSAKLGKTSLLVHAMLPTPHQVASGGLPRLRFEKSLSVSIQMSAIPAVVTSLSSQYAMVGYTLD